MLYLAITLFGIAVILGLILLTYLLKNKSVPKNLALTHGSFAVTGIILLVIYAFFHSPKPIMSIIIFTLAAMGGLILVYKELSGKPLPKVVAVGHGLLAFIGFITLIIFACP